MTNPYQTSGKLEATALIDSKNFRSLSYALTAFAIPIGCIHLPPFLISLPTIWGWQNWWFGFAPAAYLVVVSIIAVYCELSASRKNRILLPIYLSPLLAVIGLITVWMYLDGKNIVAGKYSLPQNLHTLLVVSLCPVALLYLLVSSIRSIRLILHHQG